MDNQVIFPTVSFHVAIHRLATSTGDCTNVIVLVWGLSNIDAENIATEGLSLLDTSILSTSVNCVAYLNES